MCNPFQAVVEFVQPAVDFVSDAGSAAGEVLSGLVRRREAEALLFQGKEWHEV